MPDSGALVRGRRRLAVLAEGLDAADRRSLARMGLVVLLLHVVGVGVLLLLAGSDGQRPSGGATPVLGLGVGVLAYTFGLRHAFDADHIAAVDNTTRKLLADRTADPGVRRPLSVGFWFSLGHSSVVLALALLLAVGVRSLASQVRDGTSTLHTVAAVVGASVSGMFLWVLGLLNLGVLLGVVRVFRRLRRGEFDEAELEAQLDRRGLLSRLLGGLTRAVRRPWQVYPVGLLFGLGFDTATEVGLLVLAGGAAATALPLPAVLVLPVLFAAGMCLMDTLDGVLMTGAYGWALRTPVRKVYYNLAVTTVSVAVALGVGTVELVGVLADRTGVASGPLAAVAALPLDAVGYVIAGSFVLAWVVALGVWRFGRIEERWSARVATGRPR